MPHELDEDIELLIGTIRDLTESIDRLTEQRDKLSAEIRAKIDRRLIWESRLATLRQQVEKPFDEDAPTKPAKSKRRRKGENLRAVRELFANNKDRGFSVTEISEQLGIAWSSARRTLEKNKLLFVERDNLWFLKQLDRNGNGDERDLLS
jgi:response regulator of citrate/malate metabolism